MPYPVFGAPAGVSSVAGVGVGDGVGEGVCAFTTPINKKTAEANAAREANKVVFIKNLTPFVTLFVLVVKTISSAFYKYRKTR